MKRVDFENYLKEKKKIKIFLRNEYVYVGVLKELYDDFLVIIDKRGIPVKVEYSFIALVEELGDING